MPRVGLFGKRPTTRKPDAVTKELVAFLSRVDGIDTVNIVSGDEVELVVDGRRPVALSLEAVRAELHGTSGLDRLEKIESFVESATRTAVFQPTEDDFAAPSLADDLIGAPPPAGADPIPPPVTAPPPAGPPAAPIPAPSWADVSSRARPVVRHRAALPPGVVHWSVVGSLALAVTVDDAFVTTDHVGGWAIPENSVAEAAIRWLIAQDPVVEELGPGVRGWVPGGPVGSQAAWLAQPGMLLGPTGLTEAVAFAATPTDVVFVDPSDTALLAQIEEATKGLFDSGDGTLIPDALVVTPDAVRLR